ncbi:hypothetical protein [Mycobacteroides chelonae]|uniref:Uncharacterized protein n=1 Tax=Mycobacteroides chelonae TaxID=1774 RepID=A0A1S1LTM7_MYCCH|nr:hypothetical protein [Mycobacteroides chelonae]OHU76134.1 hypothetical protein BKG84_24900 [Mycobacteroides chelonae]
MTLSYEAVRSAVLLAARQAQVEGVSVFDAAWATIDALCGDLPEAQRYEWIGRVFTDLHDGGFNQPRMN